MSKVKMQISIVTLVIFFLLCMSCNAKDIVMDLLIDGKIVSYSAEEVVLKVDNKEVITGEMPPIIINERTLVPAREMFETMGAKVEWIQELKEVYVTLNSSKIKLKINSDIAIIEKDETITECTLEVTAKIINNKTMIPFRAVAEAIGCKVEWVQDLRTILVTTPLVMEDEKETEISKENSNTDEIIKNDEIDGKDNEKDLDDEDTESNEKKEEVEDVEIDDELIAESITKNSLSWRYKNSIELDDVDIEYEENIKTTIVSVQEDFRNEKYAKFTIDATEEITDVKVSVYNQSLILDIINAKKDILSEYEFLINEYVERFRSSQYTNEDVRCVFDLKASFAYEVELSNNRKQIIIKLHKNEIGKIKYSESKKEGTFTIESSGYMDYNVSRLTDDDRIYIDIYNAKSYFGNKTSKLSDSVFVKKIRSGINEDDVRFVIDTTEQYNYEVKRIDDNKIELTIKKLEYENIEYSNLKERTLKIDISEFESLDEEDVEITEDYMNGVYKVSFECEDESLYGSGIININDSIIENIEIKSDNETLDIMVNTKNNTIVAFDVYIKKSKLYVEILMPSVKYDEVLVLDAGHGLGATGNKDSGAVVNGYCEKDYNLKLALYIEEYISENSDIKVYLTRENDSKFMNYIENYENKNRYLYGRAQVANEIKADMFVSIHNNSMGTSKSQWNGTEVLYNPNKECFNGKSSYNGLTNEKLATILAKDIIDGTNGLYKNNNTEKRNGKDIKDGISERTDLAVLNISEVPAALIELAFMTNENDLKKLNDESYLKLASQEIGKSIINIFEEYKLYKNKE